MPGRSSTVFSYPCGVIGAFRDRLDRDFGGIPNLVLALEEAITRHKHMLAATPRNSPSRSRSGSNSTSTSDEGDWAGIIQTVTAISQKLLKEVPSDGAVDQVSADREVRDDRGHGMPKLLLLLLLPTMCHLATHSLL